MQLRLRVVDLAANMPTVPATAGGCKGRSEVVRGLAPALPARAAGGRGEADNELIARRSTAARSANHGHFLLVPAWRGVVVCGANGLCVPRRSAARGQKHALLTAFRATLPASELGSEQRAGAMRCRAPAHLWRLGGAGRALVLAARLFCIQRPATPVRWNSTPNVRAKLAPTAWRAGQQAQNGPQAQRLMASAPCRWCSA
jgi:hypothetical protein